MNFWLRSNNDEVLSQILKITGLTRFHFIHHDLQFGFAHCYFCVECSTSWSPTYRSTINCSHYVVDFLYICDIHKLDQISNDQCFILVVIQFHTAQLQKYILYFFVNLVNFHHNLIFLNILVGE
jgi:hypothetical protein